MTTPKTNRLKKALLEGPPELSHDYERALGRLAIDFALQHFLLERYGWAFWGLHPEFAQILTKDLPMKQLVEKFRASLKEIELESDLQSSLITILNKVQKLAEQRNDLLHALWVFEDDKPVLCYRRRAKIPDETAPSIREIESLSTAINEVTNELVDFDKRNSFMLLAPIAIAQKRKYGSQGAVSPKQPK